MHDLEVPHAGCNAVDPEPAGGISDRGQGRAAHRNDRAAKISATHAVDGDACDYGVTGTR